MVERQYRVSEGAQRARAGAGCDEEGRWRRLENEVSRGKVEGMCTRMKERERVRT